MTIDRDPVRAVRAMRLTRRTMLRFSALAGGSLVASGLGAWGTVSAASRSPRGSSALAPLPGEIMAIMGKPRYAQSTWNLLVTDVGTVETLYELQADQMAFTGSVRKLFSVGLALNELGADHRFTTPVYRRGAVDAQGALTGDLVVVAAGDLILGGRVNADDTVTFTDFDHNDANNLDTAILSPQDPLRGLDNLAQQVGASGIRAVSGDVIIDDRFFDSFRVPNQNLLITPIMVNENMVDVSVSPAQPGQTASLDWRPRTAAFVVNGSVNTVALGAPETVMLSGNGLVECIGTAACAGTVQGDIPVDYQAPLSDSPTWVRTFRVEDPATFARTAFIDALARAGVTVSAPSVGRNPTERLPAPGQYAPDTRVAQLVSPRFSEYAKLILKVSLNLGANLSLMLLPTRAGNGPLPMRSPWSGKRLSTRWDSRRATSTSLPTAAGHPTVRPRRERPSICSPKWRTLLSLTYTGRPYPFSGWTGLWRIPATTSLPEAMCSRKRGQRSWMAR
jgi:D-alanyl-D-alanine carboxypeptidase